MDHSRQENKNVLSRERKLSRNLKNALPLAKSLAIFGFTCWKEFDPGIDILFQYYGFQMYQRFLFILTLL